MRDAFSSYSSQCHSMAGHNYFTMIVHALDRTCTVFSWYLVCINAGGDCKTEHLISAVKDGNITVKVCNYTVRIPPNRKHAQCGQLRLVQLDHRGGYCDCWAVSFQDAEPSK